jgi:hypothetical protein
MAGFQRISHPKIKEVPHEGVPDNPIISGISPVELEKIDGNS